MPFMGRKGKEIIYKKLSESGGDRMGGGDRMDGGDRMGGGDQKEEGPGERGGAGMGEVMGMEGRRSAHVR